jgi:two-component system response regulator FixJ
MRQASGRLASQLGDLSDMAANRQPRVLIVDDDPSVRAAMRVVLEGAGYEVVQAVDGLQALSRCRETALDLLILDLHLPVMSGLEFYAHFSKRFPSIPVIAISGNPEHCQTALAAGISTFLEKPVDAPGLLNRIDELLTAARKHASPGTPAATNATRPLRATRLHLPHAGHDLKASGLQHHLDASRPERNRGNTLQ